MAGKCCGGGCHQKKVEEKAGEGVEAVPVDSGETDADEAVGSGERFDVV